MKNRNELLPVRWSPNTLRANSDRRISVLPRQFHNCTLLVLLSLFDPRWSATNAIIKLVSNDHSAHYKRIWKKDITFNKLVRRWDVYVIQWRVENAMNLRFICNKVILYANY